MEDGSYNPEPTILPAVVMHFNLLDEDKCRSVLTAYAGNGFSTDWGVRILSSGSSLFNPQGYHYGSVWPLYTGWTTLAEYQYGRSTQAFSHLVNNLMIKNHWALGFVEEVMNGVTYQPAGVCPHQCWSETNILHPGLAGMIGWKPFALERVAEIRPRFPAHWNAVRVNHLRIGNARLSMDMERYVNETRYRFQREQGKPVHIKLFPDRLNFIVN